MKEMFTKNEVVKLIEIVTGQTQTFEDIISSIAKTDPQILLDAVGYQEGDEGVAFKYFRENPSCTKIEAIKHVRGQLGLGLKEAKDLVEEVAEKYNFQFRQWS